MIEINKTEAEALRKAYGDQINITITSRNKKGGRKRYYADETNRVLRFIGKNRIEHTKRGGGVD